MVIVTVLELVGGAPGGETPRVADSSAAGAGHFYVEASGKILASKMQSFASRLRGDLHQIKDALTSGSSWLSLAHDSEK